MFFGGISVKTIEPIQITNEVKRLCIEAATYLEKDILHCLDDCSKNECGLAKSILEQIIENDNLAASENVPN